MKAKAKAKAQTLEAIAELEDATTVVSLGVETLRKRCATLLADLQAQLAAQSLRAEGVEPPEHGRTMRLLPGGVIVLAPELVAHLRAEVGEMIGFSLEPDGEVRLAGEKSLDEFWTRTFDGEGESRGTR